MKVGTVLSDEGKTRIVPYESRIIPLKIEFFEEIWVNRAGDRRVLCKVVLEDNEVQLSEPTVWELLRRLGHVLLALTEDIEQ